MQLHVLWKLPVGDAKDELFKLHQVVWKSKALRFTVNLPILEQVGVTEKDASVGKNIDQV